MEQDVDVAATDAERSRDVLTGLLLEQAQHDHGLLGLTQLIDATPEADVLLRLGDQRLRRRTARRDERERIDVVVRKSEVVTAAPVTGRVAHDSPQEGRPLAALAWELVLLRELQKRAECILYALDRILRRSPLPARHADELAPPVAGEIAEDAEDIGFGRAARHHF